MVSTQLAVVDAEIVEPLNKTKAKDLDKRIRQASSRMVDNMAILLDLLEEAMIGQIHVFLKYPSWTAYVKDAVQILPANDDERKALVSLMSGKGVSQRAIADVVGVNQATVSRDLSGDANASPEISGTDGKIYKRKAEPQAKKEPSGAKARPAARIPSVSQDFADEMVYLDATVSSFNDIVKDERFSKARKTIARAHLISLQENVFDLQAVIEQLMED